MNANAHWQGTAFAELAGKIDDVPVLRMVYRIGAIDQTVIDLFGGESPEEAREVASVLMVHLCGSGNETDVQVSERVAALVKQWKARRSLQ